LEHLLPGRIIACVSGTNGKTTTTHLLTAALKASLTDPHRVVTNADGANLHHGIASALAMAPKADIAVLETDERVVPDVIRLGRPAVLVLDEATQPLDGWAKGRIARTVARIAASCATSIATFSLISLATGLGFGWLKAVNVPGLVVTVSPFTLVGQGIQLVLNYFQLDRTEHAAIRYSRTVGLVISAAGTLLMAVTVARRRPIAFLSWSYLLIAFGGPALHSWYVLWGSLLLPLTNPSRRLARVALWTTIVLLCYSAVNLAWRNGALALGIAALGGFWWQLNHHERAESRRSEEDR